MDELTKRYLKEANKTKKQSAAELDPAKARIKKAEYQTAKKHYQLAVEHYHALMGRYADDTLVVADEWRASIGKVLSDWDKATADARADANENRIDYQGQAMMTYYGRTYSKDKMYNAMHKLQGTDGSWDNWHLWKLGDGRMVWLDGAGDAIDAKLPKKKGINSKLYIKVSLHHTGGIMTVKNTNGKPMEIPMFKVMEPPRRR